jgi:carbon-monoxide dehydrogenase medium subunit
MKPAPFTYHRPSSVADAVALLATHAPEDGRVLAGGQSLVPIMAFRLSRPAHLIDINRVAGLDVLAVEGDVLRVGARVRHAAFETASVDGRLGELLRLVVRHIAHAPIRSRGTFCGSLAHADPASEWCLVAATLDAELVATSVRGERVIQAADFFAGIMSTNLAADELLREVRLPLLADGTAFGFREFNRRAGDFAMAMSLAVLRIENGVVAEARIGLGGAEAMPRRIGEAEAVLVGQVPSPALIDAAADAAATAIEPLEDAQTDGVYRRELVHAMVSRALADALPGAPA